MKAAGGGDQVVCRGRRMARVGAAGGNGVMGHRKGEEGREGGASRLLQSASHPSCSRAAPSSRCPAPCHPPPSLHSPPSPCTRRRPTLLLPLRIPQKPNSLTQSKRHRLQQGAIAMQVRDRAARSLPPSHPTPLDTTSPSNPSLQTPLFFCLDSGSHMHRDTSPPCATPYPGLECRTDCPTCLPRGGASPSSHLDEHVFSLHLQKVGSRDVILI